MIAPHDNYYKSGVTAAWAYKNMAEAATVIDRVVILGPAHKIKLDWIATTSCTQWSTPFGS